MRVFKLYLLLLQRQWRTIALYVTVFLGVFLLIAVLNSGNGEYQAQQIRVVLRNEDDSEVSEVLSDALQERFVVEEGLGDTEMDEALFYQAGHVAIVIPEGFGDAFALGKGTLELRTQGNNAYGELVRRQCDQFLGLLAKGHQLHPEKSYAQLCEEIRAADTPVSVEMTSALSDARSRMSTYCNFMSYVILTLMLTCIPLTISVLRAPDTQMRLSCAPLSGRSLMLQVLAGAGIFAIGLLAVLYAALTALCGVSTICSPSGLLMLLNGVLFTAASLAFALMIAFLISGHRKREKTEETVSALSNLLGLSFSFLGGAFVPQQLLSAPLQFIASFTPTYWFVRVSDQLGSGVIDPSQLLTGYVALTLFALAFALSTAVIARRRMQRDALS